MARTNNLTNFLTDIADSIREKKGTTEQIPASSFDTEIASIESGGSVEITKGLRVDEYDDNGFPIKITVIGMRDIPDTFLNSDGSTNTTGFFNKVKEISVSTGTETIGRYFGYYLTRLEKVNLPNSVTEFKGVLNANTFSYDSMLHDINLPENLKIIPTNCFKMCSSLKNIKTVPNSVQEISYSAFSESGVTQLSAANAIFRATSGSFYGAFYQCKKLVALWIPSVNTNLSYGVYTYYTDNIFKKLFIDLPREQVEVMSGYTYGFAQKTTNTTISESAKACIVCNDDEGWMTKEEFDAIDWTTVE